MGNMPMMGRDPNGQFFVPIIVGAVLGALIQGSTAWVNHQDVGEALWKGALVGALSGLAGGFAPAGILPGIGYGAATGAVLGAGQAALSGTDIGQGALFGGITGGISGGVFGGLKALSMGGNIWNGKVTMTFSAPVDVLESIAEAEQQTPQLTNTDLSDKKLHAVALQEFKFKQGDFGVKKFTAQELPDKSWSYTKDGIFSSKKYGEAFGATVYNPNSRSTEVFISKFSMGHETLMRGTIGHELIHAYHFNLGLSEIFGKNFTLLTENAAHSWQADYLSDAFMQSYDQTVMDFFQQKVNLTLMPNGRYFVPHHISQFKDFFRKRPF
jgi:hypothetical protein